MTSAPRPSSGVPATAVIAGLLVVLGLATGGLGGALVLLGLGLAVLALLALVSGRRVLVVGGRGHGALAFAVAGALVIAGGAVLAEDDDGARRVAQDGPTAGANLPSATPAPGREPSLAPSLAPTEAPAPDITPTAPATEPAPTDPATTTPEPAGPDPTDPATTTSGTALATVAELEIKGRAPRTGYDRDAFAYRTYDQDRNGCDVRNDILRRDLVDIVIGANTNGCVVQTGTVHDPYSGQAIDFVRGVGTSNAVQIDHVVALSDAWQKGAQAWDEATMREFGNDPLNLLAVDGPLNAQKGDGDTATWLPPNRGFRCAYVARQVAVKSEYQLWVTQAEHDAMVRVLSTCPDEPLPKRETVPLMPELAGAA